MSLSNSVVANKRRRDSTNTNSTSNKEESQLLIVDDGGDAEEEEERRKKDKMQKVTKDDDEGELLEYDDFADYDDEDSNGLQIFLGEPWCCTSTRRRLDPSLHAALLSSSEARNWYVCPVQGDGDCFFTALTYGLHAHGQKWGVSDLRRWLGLQVTAETLPDLREEYINAMFGQAGEKQLTTAYGKATTLESMRSLVESKYHFATMGDIGRIMVHFDIRVIILNRHYGAHDTPHALLPTVPFFMPTPAGSNAAGESALNACGGEHAPHFGPPHRDEWVLPILFSPDIKHFELVLNYKTKGGRAPMGVLPFHELPQGMQTAYAAQFNN